MILIQILNKLFITNYNFTTVRLAINKRFLPHCLKKKFFLTGYSIYQYTYQNKINLLFIRKNKKKPVFIKI